MTLIYIGIASFILMVLVGILSRLFSKPRYTPQVYDQLNTKPEKVSKSQQEVKQQNGAITYGICTQLKQFVWQSIKIQQMNTLFIGPNGIGKTTHIVSTALVQHIKNGKNAIVIFEGKSDKRLIGLIQRLCRDANRELLIFPYDNGYNPLNIGSTTGARAAMFASMIRLAKEGVSADAEHFTNEMVKFSNIFIPLFEAAYHVPMIPDELKQLSMSEELRTNLLDKTKGTPEHARYETTFGTYKAQDFTRNLSGLVSLIDDMYSAQGGNEGRKSLYNRRNAKGISDAIDRQAVIIIAEGGNRGSSEHHLGMMYFAELMNYVRSRQTNHNLVLMMDELHFYLSHSFTQFQATSRGANVSQILGFQTFSMLEALSREAAESIKTNCRTWLVHPDLNYPDAFVVSQKVGERPHIVYSESKNANAMLADANQGTHLEDRFLIPPYKIQNMQPDYVLYLSLKDDRGRDAARYLKKPPIFDDSQCWYIPPIASPDIPPTMWELQAKQNAQKVNPQLNQVLHGIFQNVQPPQQQPNQNNGRGKKRRNGRP